MIDIEYLENQKNEIILNHIKQYNNFKLSKTEECLIYKLNKQIKELKKILYEGKYECNN